MSLLIKPPSWGHCTSNYVGTAPSTLGTNLTAAANDADGTAVSALTAVGHDVEFLAIMAHGFNTTGANSSTLLDVLVDPAGGSSWTPIVNDLLVGQSLSASQTVPIAVYYYFPIWLKSGNSIGFRARTAHTADVTTGRVVVHAFGGNANPGSWWCGQTVETIGVDDTISQGTNHTAGVSSAFSTWTNFGTAISKPCGAIQFGVHGTNTDTTQAGNNYCWEFGVASTRIGPPIYRSTNTTESGFSLPTGPIFVSLPASTQLMVRAAAFGASAEPIDVAAYAVI